MDYPVVFIPGLFGSLGDDVLKGTGDFSFGFAEKIYRPFIEMLNSMGYVEGVDLFISYYDWKKPTLESVNNYLFPDIEKVKRKTGRDKVILIGHSLGGLLARGYMKYFAPSNIDKLIMIGTPNLGAANAYYFWGGGKLPYSKIEDNILYNGLKFGFMLYAYLFHNLNNIEAWRKIFPIAKDLLPSYEYGNYLFWKENGVEKEVPIENMSVRNNFLNELKGEFMDKDRLFVISGDGVFTNKNFEIDKKNKHRIKWVDGKPIKSYRTNYGDGTVTTTSTLGYLGGNNIVLEGNHTDILYKSRNYLSAVLGKPIIKEVKQEKIQKVYIIFAQNCEKVNINTSKDNEITSTYMNIHDNRVQAMGLGQNNFWIMVTGHRALKVKVEVESNRNIKPEIYKTIIESK